MKVYEAVAATLAANGVDTIYGLMGDANMLYLAEFISRHGGRYVAVADEKGGLSMADGYSRTSARIGVTSVTHGPGLTNTITPLVEAARNGSKVLLISGETSWRLGHAQDIDIRAVVAPTGAGYERVYRAETASADLARALRRIHAERRPIVLDLPSDILRADTPGELAPSVTPVQNLTEPAESSVEDALGLALGASRPVVLAGRGALASGAKDALLELAGILCAPVATSLLARDLFRGHPLNIGICGTVSTAATAARIVNSDCILAFGASLNQYTAFGGELLGAQRVVHCDLDPRSIATFTPVDVPVIGDARLTARTMIDKLADNGFSPDASRLAALASSLSSAPSHDAFDDRGTDNLIDLRSALVWLDQILPPDRTVVTDGGRFMQAAWKYLHVEEPSSFAQTVNFGSIGLGLSTAIGATLGRPGRPAIAVLGDGGFMMAAAELQTAARLKLPLVVAIANDSAYGAEWRKFEQYGVSPHYSRSEWPDFVTLADAMGGKGYSIRSMADLEQTADHLNNLDGPVLLDLAMDPAYDYGA